MEKSNNVVKTINGMIMINIVLKERISFNRQCSKQKVTID